MRLELWDRRIDGLRIDESRDTHGKEELPTPKPQHLRPTKRHEPQKRQHDRNERGVDDWGSKKFKNKPNFC